MLFTAEGELRKAITEHEGLCTDQTFLPSEIQAYCTPEGGYVSVRGDEYKLDGPRVRSQFVRRLSPHLSAELFWREIEDPVLRSNIARELIARQARTDKRGWLFRFKHSHDQGPRYIRAILSDDYFPIGHREVLDRMVAALITAPDTADFRLTQAELDHDGAEMRLHFVVEAFEVETSDPRIPTRWESRFEVANNEVGEGSVRVSLYLAPEGQIVGARFTARTIVVHRNQQGIQERFAKAVEYMPGEVRNLMVALQEFAGMTVEHPMAVLTALGEGFKVERLPDYAVEAVKRAFEALPGRTGLHLIWALIEAPRYVDPNRGLPYEVLLRLQRVAGWLAQRQGREWIAQLPAPVAVQVAQIAFAV